MEHEKFEDDVIIAIVKRNALKLPSDHFDDKVMSKIHYATKLKKQVANPLRLALAFFIAGTILGMGATIFFMLYGGAVLGFGARDLGLIVLFAICVSSIMGFDNLRRLIANYTT